MSSAKSFWVEDRYASRCSMCNQKFNFMRRRHHCRQCGQIFCSDCLEYVPMLPPTPHVPDQQPFAAKASVVQQGLAAMFANSAEEKVCLTCAKQRRTRVSSGVALRINAKRSASVLDRAGRPQQGPPIAPPADLRSPRLALAGNAADDLPSDDDNSSGPQGVMPLSRMVSNARTEDTRSSASRGTSPVLEPSHAFGSRMHSLASMSKSPKGIHRLPSAGYFQLEGALTGSNDDYSLSRIPTNAPLNLHPHTETAKERSICYGDQEVPMVQPNAMEQWLTKLLRKTASNPVALYAAPTCHAVPKKKVYLANPRACFRVGERVVDAGLFPTAFLDFDAFETRNGILELLERRCTAHLLRRVRWLIHEVNIRAEMEERVRLFHERRLLGNSGVASDGHVSLGGSIASPRCADQRGSGLTRRTSAVTLLSNGDYANKANRAVQRHRVTVASPRVQPSVPSNVIVTSTRGRGDSTGPEEDDIAPLLAPSVWLEAVCDIAWRVVSQTVCEREPNVLNHVDVLTLAGGDFGDTEIISGIAFFHSVANKKMRTRMEHPRILVLGGDVGLHMAVTEAKVGAAAAVTNANPTAHVTSNGTLVIPSMEFLEYTATYKGLLDKQYQRVEYWKPTLIIAERGVHHYLQDRIARESAHITLLTHVGREMLERIAVGTGADVVDNLASYSINDVLSESPLGYCTSFELTLLEPDHRVSCVMFSGLPRPTFTSVLLRGAPEKTLQAAKGVLLQAIATSHHLALQTHYLVDFNAVISQAQNMDIFEGRPTEELVVGNIGDLLANPQSPRSAATLPGARSSAEWGPAEGKSPANNPTSTTSVSSRQTTLDGVECEGPPISILPPEALSINMGITFPRDVLTCCGSTELARSCPNAVGIQHSFLRELQTMRDSIMVQNLFLEGPGVQGAAADGANAVNAAAVGIPGSGINNTTGHSGAISPSVLQQHAHNPQGLGGADSSSSSNFNANIGATQVENAETVRRQRHNYPFYQEADETLYEFLMDRVAEGKDALRHVLHGNRRVIIRSCSQMKDLFDDLRVPQSPTTTQLAASQKSPLSSHSPPPSILSSGTAVSKGGRKSVAEELSAEYLKHLVSPSSANKFVRVPHCFTTCKVCVKNRFVNPTTAPIPVSPHTLSMSLGAFLEMSVYMGRECIAMCGHSLHNDLTRYFVMYPTDGMQVTVSFDVEPLPVFQMYGPPLQLRPLPPKMMHIAAPPCCSSPNASATQEPLTKGMSLVVTGTGGCGSFGNAQDMEQATVTCTEPLAVSPTTPLLPTARSEKPMLAAPTTTSKQRPHEISVYCTNASELYFAHELQELSRNLFEVRSFQLKRYRSSVDPSLLNAATTPLNAAPNTSPSVAPATPATFSPNRSGSPDALINRYEQIAQQFTELQTLEDTTRYRIAALYPLIDDILAEKNSVPNGGGAAGGQGAEPAPSGAAKKPQVPPAMTTADVATLQSMRSQHWAYLPNEKLSIRVNEPTSVIAAVLQAMQALPIDTPSSGNGQHKRSHTRTFSMGGGVEEFAVPPGLAQPRPSRVAQVLSQFTNAFGAAPQAPAPAQNSASGSTTPFEPRRRATAMPDDLPQRLALDDPQHDGGTEDVDGEHCSVPKQPGTPPIVNPNDANHALSQRSRSSSATAIGGDEDALKDADHSSASLAELLAPEVRSTSTAPINSSRRSFGPSPLPPQGDLVSVQRALGGGDPLHPGSAHTNRSLSCTPDALHGEEGCDAAFGAVPSMFADALDNTTTIEDLLHDFQAFGSGEVGRADGTADDAPTELLGREPVLLPESPSTDARGTESASQTFVRDQFRREDEAIDVLSGKSAQQAASFKYVIRDLVMPAEATKPQVIVVEVMFPHQFAAMRYLYARDLFAQGGNEDGSAPAAAGAASATLTEDGIISSLLRCKLFQAQGGRSGAGFFITQDERLMLKKIKMTELRHFVQFAPQYFEHMVQLCMHVQHQKRAQHRRGGARTRGEMDSDDDESDVHAHDDTIPSGGLPHKDAHQPSSLGDYSSFSTDDAPPSALSKIFGVFSISFKKSRLPFGQSEVRYYMLTENIMYRRPVELSYDLKGSQLNRHAAEGSHVLLDQDLVRETKKGFFFYCREASRARVVEALTNDAQRLCAASIMDYSTIVSVDRRSEALAFGVIDYLHPYTGAKVIESKVKGGIDIVFGQGRDPTIIDPQHYKQRFLRWMDSYLCGVPDKTAQIKKRAITVVSPQEDEQEECATALPPRYPQTRVVRMLEAGSLVQLDDAEYRVV